MKYRHYRAAAHRLETRAELERLLSAAENDSGITARQYYNLKYIITNKIYQ